MRVTDKYVFFFTDKDCFSNWYIAPFQDYAIYPGHTFRCVEQYMMYRKACLFEDETTAEDIMLLRRIRQNEKEQAYYKRMGREVSDYNEEVWIQKRENIIKSGLYLKYMQNPDLMKELMKHVDRRFVEASPYDSVYGIKMGMWDSGVEDPSNWKGENLLGKLHNEILNYFRSNSGV